jgi:uncharacterized protein YcfJ
MNRKLQAIFAACGIAMATHAAAQITFYEREGLRGRAVTTDDRIPNLDRIGFNDRVSSLVVERGRWEVCEHARFEGRCVVLRPGRYGSLREIGMNNSISSARRMDRGRHHGSEAPPAVVVVPQYEQPRPHYGPPPVAVAPAPRYEPPPPAFYDVPVTSARAVVGPPSQRCWIDREQVAEHRRGEPNIGGAVVGGLVGGILGHQIGGGSGKDLATAGGVIAGAAIGANVNRGSGAVTYANRDVQRCQTVSSTKPEYWDVTYHYRGAEHRVQMTSAPGPTIRVNPEGAPMTVAR